MKVGVGAFYMDLLPLGRSLWDGGSETGTRGREDLLEVTFSEAEAYAEKVGAQLPTELQWERAARGTDARKFPWGNQPPTPERCVWWDQQCNGPADLNYMWGGQAVQEAEEALWGARPPRRPEGRGPFGHEDLVGYASEWCSDAWSVEYRQPWAKARDTRGPPEGKPDLRPRRGGDWRTADVARLEAARRMWCRLPHGRAGVRLVVEAPER
jgi:formylglycine-generating enzyme required for sulfatase activity